MSQGHYFSRDLGRPRELGRITLWTDGKTIDLLTSPGVFSYGKVDRGTIVLIDNMEVPDDGWVLDMGCGYGPLSVCASIKGSNVVGIEVNPRAAWLARKNMARHAKGSWIIILGDLYGPVRSRFESIVCNPPIRAGRGVVARIIQEAGKYLREDGSLQIVARTKMGAKTLSGLMRSSLGNVQEVEKESGYRVLLSRCRGGRVD